METNRTPVFDGSDNPTGCCPRFKPEGWDEQKLHFEAKPFARVKTRSFFYMPLDMGGVFARTQKQIERAHAEPGDQFIVLSRDLSPWSAEHLFSVKQTVPDLEQEDLSGNFLTKVFEGPYKNAPKWIAAFKAELEHRGEQAGPIYFFYTTCPKCAAAYGKNYVVAVALTSQH
jgi:hypothetical protein